MSPLEVLVAARAKLAEPGVWGQGYRGEHRDQETACMVDAIKDITGEDLILFLTCRSRLTTITMAPRVSGWNDTEGRTLDEVLSVFDRAIVNEERRLAIEAYEERQ